jgi:acyl-CoA thioesterase
LCRLPGVLSASRRLGCGHRGIDGAGKPLEFAVSEPALGVHEKRTTHAAADLMSQTHSGPESESLRVAQLAARRMWDEDKASQALGMTLADIGPGFAVLSMTVRADMANGHGMCHGGFMFLLADSAFAFACNSHNQRAVAAGAEIHFVAPAKVGDVLTAQATEQHREGRSGFYDVRVTDQNGVLIALFRGRSATIKGFLVEDAGSGSAVEHGRPPDHSAGQP